MRTRQQGKIKKEGELMTSNLLSRMPRKCLASCFLLVICWGVRGGGFDCQHKRFSAVVSIMQFHRDESQLVAAIAENLTIQ